MAATCYWYDYETWGNDPALDRPCQFAGLRTDTELNELGQPLVLFARPATDLLPQPEACLVTGITPDQALSQGIPEAEFARAIQQTLAAPGTCSVGYNSLRFDDRVNNWLFYRNLLEPYAHAWQHGNSRWDLIDVLRLAHALRPQGLCWPEREPGVTSFKLEDLTAANAVEHLGAHDALADVRATLAMARRLKAAQPRLFDYALKLRDKAFVTELLASGEPLLHASQRYPAALGCLAPVIKVAAHPTQKNLAICFDLRQDPTQILDLTPEELHQRLFSRRDDRSDGLERLPVKGVKANAAPMLAPMKTLTAEMAERWQIDPGQVAAHAGRARKHRREIGERLEQAFSSEPRWPETTDPEQMLYSGGFFSDRDRRLMDELGCLSPSELAETEPHFEDARLPTLLFRMRARSWPETLTESEREDWDAWRFERLTDSGAGASITIDAYEAKLLSLRAERRGDPSALAVIDRLEDWGEQVMTAEEI
ncbi:exodeoxyribonuclease I [Halochromatium sp.]